MNIDVSAFNTSPRLQEKLRSFGFVKTFEAEEVILNENAFIKAIPIVVHGLIRVMQTDEDAHEILLYYINAGESCVMSFLGGIHGDASRVSAVAEEPTEILFIPLDKVELLVKEYPEWVNYIFKLYHKRFEELLDMVNAVAFKRMDERILGFITTKVHLTGQSILKITHEQIANELGTARVVVSRILKQMEQKNLIEMGRGSITLL